MLTLDPPEWTKTATARLLEYIENEYGVLQYFTETALTELYDAVASIIHTTHTESQADPGKEPTL